MGLKCVAHNVAGCIMCTEFKLNDKYVLDSVHPAYQCQGNTCVIHNQTPHHLQEWSLHWRDDRGFFERICPHGVGHPDPDDIYADPVHGCHMFNLGDDLTVMCCSKQAAELRNKDMP